MVTSESANNFLDTVNPFCPCIMVVNESVLRFYYIA